MQKRKIYFLFDFPNISRSWAGLRRFVYLYNLIDWNQLKRCLKQHAHDNYPGVLNLEFVVFLNRRTARESRGRIHSLKQSGFKIFPKRKEEEDSDIDDDIAHFVENVVTHPDTAAVYVIGNDLRNASRIAEDLTVPKYRGHEDGECRQVYDGEADLWVGIMPSAMMPETNLDRFPFNTNVVDLEEFPNVFS